MKYFIFFGRRNPTSHRLPPKTKRSAAIAALALATLAFCRLFFSAPAYVPASAPMEREPVEVPIIMYHSILKSPTRAGVYVVSPSTFEADLTYLKERGYESVFLQDLIDYVYQGVPLPDQPVVITLDDGYYNNLVYVLPILEQLDMKAVISVVGEFTQTFSETPDPNPNYGHLSWKDIKDITASGHVEIGNHSYAMHGNGPRKGSAPMQGETAEHYRTVFTEDAMKLQQMMEENTGIVPVVYTYPFGLKTEDAAQLIQDMGFLCSMICYERINIITNEESLFDLGRFNRPSGENSQAFFQRVLG